MWNNSLILLNLDPVKAFDGLHLECYMWHHEAVKFLHSVHSLDWIMRVTSWMLVPPLMARPLASFVVGKGIWQGDPCSPYLYLANLLGSLLKEMLAKRITLLTIKGSLKMSNLIHVDDFILCYSANQNSCVAIALVSTVKESKNVHTARTGSAYQSRWYRFHYSIMFVCPIAL